MADEEITDVVRHIAHMCETRLQWCVSTERYKADARHENIAK